jgi:chromosome segregation ATPase
MAGMKREHSRVLDEQNRALQEFAGQEGEARMHMEVLIRQKAEADVEMRTLKDRVGALKDEVERLRRQVHELQQESADKEVKMLQVTKQRAQDKEDLQGLNIALDSKQQELELVRPTRSERFWD